jgi:hypothetical protein
MARLRGKKPEDTKSRLKLLLSGAAGCGKTMAAIQMPRPYVIDTERGCAHYGELIEAAGGVVFETTSVDEIISEVRTLMSEAHPFLTLVVDPLTIPFGEAVDAAEKRLGSDYGKHFVEAGKQFKRLAALLTSHELDMNVIVTCHEKVEYEMRTDQRGKKEMVQVGHTFDGWKKLDYVFDLWLRLARGEKADQRVATVRKTRLAEFPDGESFVWKYGALVDRYGKELLERGVATVELAPEEMVAAFEKLLLSFTADEQKELGVTKALKGYDDLRDVPKDRIERGIAYLREHLKGLNGSAERTPTLPCKEEGKPPAAKAKKATKGRPRKTPAPEPEPEPADPSTPMDSTATMDLPATNGLRRRLYGVSPVKGDMAHFFLHWMRWQLEDVLRPFKEEDWSLKELTELNARVMVTELEESGTAYEAEFSVWLREWEATAGMKEALDG